MFLLKEKLDIEKIFNSYILITIVTVIIVVI